MFIENNSSLNFDLVEVVPFYITKHSDYNLINFTTITTFDHDVEITHINLLKSFDPSAAKTPC